MSCTASVTALIDSICISAMATALENALLALQGLSVGDAFGECFFSASGEFLRNRDLPPPPWVWTDDTHMAASIVETLRDHGQIQEDALAEAFTKRFIAELYRGYGKGRVRPAGPDCAGRGLAHGSSEAVWI